MSRKSSWNRPSFRRFCFRVSLSRCMCVNRLCGIEYEAAVEASSAGGCGGGDGGSAASGAASAASLRRWPRESREVDSGRRPASASIIQHATATATATTRPRTKGSRAHCGDTYQAPVRPGRRLSSGEPQASGVSSGTLIPCHWAGRERRDLFARGARALRKGRDVARVCACGALAAGARCGVARGVPPQVMQRAATVARTGKIEGEGRGTGARTRIDTAAARRSAARARIPHYTGDTVHFRTHLPPSFIC